MNLVRAQKLLKFKSNGSFNDSLKSNLFYSGQ